MRENVEGRSLMYKLKKLWPVGIQYINIAWYASFIAYVGLTQGFSNGFKFSLVILSIITSLTLYVSWRGRAYANRENNTK